MYVNVDDYCRIRYGEGWDSTGEKRKSKRDTVSRMCRDGVVSAVKSGRRWLIRLEDESAYR